MNQSNPIQILKKYYNTLSSNQLKNVPSIKEIEKELQNGKMYWKCHLESKNGPLFTLQEKNKEKICTYNLIPDCKELWLPNYNKYSNKSYIGLKPIHPIGKYININSNSSNKVSYYFCLLLVLIIIAFYFLYN